MTKRDKPQLKPSRPSFSSGPCPKPPGWSTDWLKGALTGRSHRSAEGRAKLKLAIDRTTELLRLPADFRVAIVPGSDTGAFEMALWSLLGSRGVTLLAWESFGKLWVRDVVGELKIKRVTTREAHFGHLPDLTGIDFNDDVIFTANGTTSGVAIPDYAWIAADRDGLTLVDGTSALFSQPVDWAKVDVLTFSWQKGLGGEAAHGMLILGPRAIQRLERHVPPWPMPKLFRLVRDGKLDEPLFEGVTINTPSMIAVEDYIASLDWAFSIGGIDALHARARRNADVMFSWIGRTAWVRNLARERATWSSSSVCLAFADPVVSALDQEGQRKFAGRMTRLLAAEGVAFDIGAYRDAPAGLRVWTGPTVDARDLECLTAWLDWTFDRTLAEFKG